MPRSLASRTSRCGALPHLGDRARRRAQLGVDARSGSSRRRARRAPDLVDGGRARRAGTVSASSHSCGARARRAARPAARTCWLRLLGRDVAGTRRPPRASAAATCSSSVDLPMPGSPPSRVTEPGHQAAAEHPVELGHPGRSRGTLGGVDLEDRCRPVGRPDPVERAPCRTGDLDLLDEGVPRTARRAPSRPLRCGGAAVRATVGGAQTSHGEDPRQGVRDSPRGAGTTAVSGRHPCGTDVEGVN